VESVPNWKEFKDRVTSADSFLYHTGMGFSVRAIHPDGQVMKYYEPFLKPRLSLFQISKSDVKGDKSWSEKEDKSVTQKITGWSRSQTGASLEKDIEEVLKLECGLKYSVTRTQSVTDDEEYTERLSVVLNLKELREWLGLQLGVDDDRIAPGVVVI